MDQETLEAWGALGAVPVLGIVAVFALWVVYAVITRRRNGDDDSD